MDGRESYQQRTNSFYVNRIKQHAAEHKIPIILIDRHAYEDETERGKYSTDEYIAEHCADILAAGANPDFVRSKLSEEDIWQNYDALKEYMPDLNLETEFNNLVNTRFANALTEIEHTPTDEERRQAYYDVVKDILFGPDLQTYTQRGGDEQLLWKISRKARGEEPID